MDPELSENEQDGDEDDEILLEKTVFLYNIPPPTLKSAQNKGDSANDKKGEQKFKASKWDIANPVKTCKLVLIAAGPGCHIQLESENENLHDDSGDLGQSTSSAVFGQAVVNQNIESVLQPTSDSSRYFAFKFQNIKGEYEQMGLGFINRDDSADLMNILKLYFTSENKEAVIADARKNIASTKQSETVEHTQVVVSEASTSAPGTANSETDANLSTETSSHSKVTKTEEKSKEQSQNSEPAQKRKKPNETNSQVASQSKVEPEKKAQVPISPKNTPTNKKTSKKFKKGVKAISAPAVFTNNKLIECALCVKNGRTTDLRHLYRDCPSKGTGQVKPPNKSNQSSASKKTDVGTKISTRVTSHVFTNPKIAECRVCVEKGKISATRHILADCPFKDEIKNKKMNKEKSAPATSTTSAKGNTKKTSEKLPSLLNISVGPSSVKNPKSRNRGRRGARKSSVPVWECTPNDNSNSSSFISNQNQILSLAANHPNFNNNGPNPNIPNLLTLNMEQIPHPNNNNGMQNNFGFGPPQDYDEPTFWQHPDIHPDNRNFNRGEMQDGVFWQEPQPRNFDGEYFNDVDPECGRFRQDQHEGPNFNGGGEFWQPNNQGRNFDGDPDGDRFNHPHADFNGGNFNSQPMHNEYYSDNMNMSGGDFMPPPLFGNAPPWEWNNGNDNMNGRGYSSLPDQGYNNWQNNGNEIEECVVCLRNGRMHDLRHFIEDCPSRVRRSDFESARSDLVWGPGRSRRR